MTATNRSATAAKPAKDPFYFRPDANALDRMRNTAQKRVLLQYLQLLKTAIVIK